MNRSQRTDTLADGIRSLYTENTADAETAIEEYLLQELQPFDDATRQEVLSELITRFPETMHPAGNDLSRSDRQFLYFCSLLLGHPVESTELGTGALQQRLTQSLTTIFEALNQLTRAINLTLLEESQTQETIRFLIGEQLDGESGTKPLEKHLDQIKDAFVTSHRAFKMAAQITVQKILDDLSPEAMVEDQKGFKFGPLRKAEAFDRYSTTFNNFRQWFESGQCMQEFFRTFEKQCHEISRQPGR